MQPSIRAAFAVALTISACGGDVAKPDPTNDLELITTLTLRFAPVGGGAPVEFSFDDPDGDGGAPATIDPIVLTASTTYALAVRLENRLAMPIEDITSEVEAEGVDHQLFFTGSAVADARLTHAYADVDAEGLPVGLANDITTHEAGAGTLLVTLRHMPPVNGVAVKTADLAARAAASGVAGLPGDTDVAVTFSVTIR